MENTSTDKQGRLVMFQSCPVCGRWKGLLDVFVAELGVPDNRWLMPHLAAHIRQANAAGEETVELTAENWRSFAEAHAFTPFSKKRDLLLRWYVKKSAYAGDYVALMSQGIYPLVDAANQNEVAFLNEALLAGGLVDARKTHSNDYRISPKGWDYLHPTIGGVPGSCFVAMSFASELQEAFDSGFLLAIESDCGFAANRVDRTAHNDNITDRIIAGIRSAEFVVADFTLQRQGVYYEAGFAEGLGRTVIRTCRNDDFANLHFDTRQFFHLKWSTPADLRILLADHIRATIGTRENRRM